MGEVDRGCERQYGEVVVGGVVVVARVLGDGGDVVPVRHGVRGVVLAHQHLAQCALSWFTEPLDIKLSVLTCKIFKKNTEFWTENSYN